MKAMDAEKGCDRKKKTLKMFECHKRGDDHELAKWEGKTKTECVCVCHKPSSALVQAQPLDGSLII